MTCQNVKVIVVLHRVLHREDCLPTSEEIHIEAKLKDDRVELPSSLNVEENLNAWAKGAVDDLDNLGEEIVAALFREGETQKNWH